MMRTRSTGVLETESRTWTSSGRNTDCSAKSPGAGSVETPLMGETKTMTDVVTSRYRERSARGEIIVNPMTSVKVQRTATGDSSLGWTRTNTSPCHSAQTFTQGGFLNLDELLLNSIGCVHLAGSPNDISQLGTLAGTKAQAGIADPTFNGSVFIGELRETLSMLRNPLRSVDNFVRRAARDKHRKVRPSSAKAMSTLSFIEENWLAYRYGIRPIMSDIESARKAIVELKNPLPLRQTSRGTATDTAHNADSGDVSAWNSTIKYDRTTSTETSVRAGVVYQVRTGYDTFGIRSRELPLTAWELIPFSFVVDWFVNVGSYIDAITPHAGVDVLGSWTTTRIKNVSTLTCSREYNGVYNTTASGYGSVDFTTVSTHRSPGLRIGLDTKIAPFGGNYGKKRILDAFALIDLNLRGR